MGVVGENFSFDKNICVWNKKGQDPTFRESFGFGEGGGFGGEVMMEKMRSLLLTNIDLTTMTMFVVVLDWCGKYW